MNRTLSSVHRGTAFEQCSLNLLQTHFSMSLRRVGGKSDGGIDLLGWWWLPFTPTTHGNATTDYPGALVDPQGVPRRRLRVLAQCKAERKKFSPRYVREMEGVWHLHSKSSSMSSISMGTLASDSHSPLSSSLPTLGNAYPTVALLLSESAFSQSTLLHAYRSTVPFLLIHIPSVSPSIPSEDDLNPTTNVNVNASAAHCTTESPLGSPELGSVCPNPALTQLVHPLSFRWERNPTFAPRGTMIVTMTNTPTTGIASWVRGRPGLWWNGRKLGSWVPDDQTIRPEGPET